MTIALDRQDDVLYLTLDDSTPVADSQEVVPGLIVDFDANNAVVGVEILNVSRRIAAKDLESVDFKIAR